MRVMKERKTRRLTDPQLSARLNDGCPRCGKGLVSRARMVTSVQTGRSRFAGSFFGCSSFPDCDYHLSLEGVESLREGDRDPIDTPTRRPFDWVEAG